jgi:hypothetical protein
MSASNLQLDDAVRRERQHFAAMIREAAGSPTVAVVRVTHHTTRHGTRFHNAAAWTYNYAPVVLDVAQQLAVVRLLSARRTDIDWTAGHDYHLDTFMLRRTPGPGRIGHRPSLERAFGGTDPVFLPRIPAQRSETTS